MHIWLRRAAIAAAAVSMGFTAYFGWVTGGDDTFAKWFNAAGGALISFAVPAFFFLSAIAAQRNALGIAKTFFAFGCVFGFMDAASNTGSLFAMREGSKINAQHATSSANDVRARLASFRKTEADLIGKTSNTKVWQDSKSIKDSIAELEKKRAREAARGGCGSECEKIDDRLLKKRDDLSISLAVEKANADLVIVRKKIAETLSESKTTKPKVSPIDVITSKIGAIAMRDLNPGESVKEFVYLIITATLGTGLTLLSGGLGYGATWLRGDDGGVRDPASGQTANAYPRYIAADPEYPPQPLVATPVPGGTTTTETTYNVSMESGSHPSLDNLKRMLEHIEAKRAKA